MSSLDECDEFLECPYCSKIHYDSQFWAGIKKDKFNEIHYVFFNSDKYVQTYKGRGINCPKVNITEHNMHRWARLEDLDGIYEISCQTCNYVIKDKGLFNFMLYVAKKTIEKHEADIHV
jgi:hypothetical protein